VQLLLTRSLVRAQQVGKVARIGFLGSGFPAAWASRLDRMGLRDLGYEEGNNIAFQFRWAHSGKYDQLRELAAELVQLKVDVLITYGHQVTLAAKLRLRPLQS
jgi:putative tryptophan/tyrosine transport system substrate-binding protein